MRIVRLANSERIMKRKTSTEFANIQEHGVMSDKNDLDKQLKGWSREKSYKDCIPGYQLVYCGHV